MSKDDKMVYPQPDGNAIPTGVPLYVGGMTLREYAAVHIMAGYRASAGYGHSDSPGGDIVASYVCADTDALLAELAKSREEAGE